MEFKFDLGDPVRDKITGFEGVVLCRSEYLTNCNRYGIQSRVLCGDLPQDLIFLDEGILEKSGLNIKEEIGNCKSKIGFSLD